MLFSSMACPSQGWTHCLPSELLSCSVITYHFYIVSSTEELTLEYFQEVCVNSSVFLHSDTDLFTYLSKKSLSTTAQMSSRGFPIPKREFGLKQKKKNKTTIGWIKKWSSSKRLVLFSPWSSAVLKPQQFYSFNLCTTQCWSFPEQRSLFCSWICSTLVTNLFFKCI